MRIIKTAQISNPHTSNCMLNVVKHNQNNANQTKHLFKPMADVYV